MAKKIHLQRGELVWEYRDLTWGEQDWKDYLDYLKDEQGGRPWQKDWADQIYAAIKDVSWDDVVALFTNYEENKDKDIKIVFKNPDGEGGSYEGVETLYDLIKDQMSDDCANNDECYYGDMVDCYDEFNTDDDEAAKSKDELPW